MMATSTKEKKALRQRFVGVKFEILHSRVFQSFNLEISLPVVR